jgi:hypothetical protein
MRQANVILQTNKDKGQTIEMSWIWIRISPSQWLITIKPRNWPLDFSKSTSGTCQFLGRSLVSCSLKKQNLVTLSTVEVEYVTVGSCCAQLLWMRQTLKNYGYTINQVPLLCDNESDIKIIYHPCEHSWTKIDIQHYFLRDHAIKGILLCLMCEPMNNLLIYLLNPLIRRDSKSLGVN